VRAFDQVDVFTAELMTGNPVAVVHDAAGITSEQMAAFARWTNLSETTFLLPPSDPGADYRLRIFTTAQELPFAGHPTLGSARAWLEAGNRPRQDGMLVQECAAGLIRIQQDGDRLAFAAPPLLRDGPVEPSDVEQLSRALGVRPDQVVDAQWADNGPGWVALLLDSAETVLAVQPDAAAFGEFRSVGIVGPAGADAEVDFELRAFVLDEDGAMWEDPVTGSLNAAVAQWLIGTGRAPTSYVAQQGTRLSRRGRVHLLQRDGQVWVGGDTVVGITGTVAL
jgi:PhzF family phenazine biosynthesis protein